MFIVDGYELSDNMRVLYEEVQSLKDECKVSINIVDKIPGEGDNADGSQETTINGDIIIYIKNTEFLESILSHELLHAYFLRKGYPNHYYPCGYDNPIYFFGRDFYNHVIHKLILEEQIRRGFDINSHQQSLAKNIISQDLKEDKDPYKLTQYSTTILLCEVLCGEYKEVYESIINKNMPKSHTIAKQQYNAMMKEEYQSPIETRMAIVRIFKRFNSILKSYKLPNLNLNENVVITFFPTEEELKLKVFKVFHLCKQPRVLNGITYWILIANSDDQAAYLIATTTRKYEEIVSLLRGLTVKELYEDSNCILNLN